MSSCAVSVIVAAYNVAPYIEQCLDSLVTQAVDQIEILAIDDGSTDNTLTKLKLYQARFPAKVRVITQSNQGLSVVRNVGLAEASCKYVGFVDGDDWVSRDMYLELFTGLEQHEADVAIGNGVMVDHTTGHTRPFADRGTWVRLKAGRGQMFDPARNPDVFMLDTSACRRLYRAEFLRQQRFRFAEGFLFEDVPAHFELLCKTNRLVLIDRPFYYYRVGHPGRITDRTDRQILQIIEVMARVVTALQTYEAEPELWANFIWFQDWVLRWLGSQVEKRFARDFARGACSVAAKFPASGIQIFQDKFCSDQLSQAGVKLQVLGREDAYIDFIRSHV